MNREKLPDYIFGFMPILHRKLLRRRPNCPMPHQRINVLTRIAHHDGKPMKFYGHKMQISRPNMTKVVDALIAEALVTRGTDQDDRRIVTLHITPKGKELVDEHIKDIRAQILETTSSLSDDEIQALLDSFETIKRIFDKLDDQVEEQS